MDTEETGTPKLRVVQGGLEPEAEGSEPSEAGENSTRSGKAASGLTLKQEEFCKQLAAGATNADAYRAAFDADGYKPATLYTKASALALREDIRRRVDEIMAAQRAKAQHVGERMTDRIWRNLWALAEDSATPPATKVAALSLAAKAAGMLVERVETKSVNASEDIERELREKLARFTKAS